MEINISHKSDVVEARKHSRMIGQELGFNDKNLEEIVLVISELASNILKYGDHGLIKIQKCYIENEIGIEILALDSGSGFQENPEIVISDGYSSSDSLGYGLGTVIRLFDDFFISNNPDSETGSMVTCRKWVKKLENELLLCPLDIGAASRAFPGMTVNGDSFVIKKWNHYVLAGVIDGVGHGQFAHRAARKARSYIEDHYDRPLFSIFQGVGRVCRGTRGVVMALIRIDWKNGIISVANVGNIELRVNTKSEPIHFIVRRGILGFSNIFPKVSESKWNLSNFLVMFSDGISSHWNWDDYFSDLKYSATEISHRLLHKLAREHDDATVLVIKERVK